MRRALILFVFGLIFLFQLSTALAQTNQVTPTWTFQTYGLLPYGTKTIVITPLRKVGRNGNLVAIGDVIRGSTTNSSFTTNLLNGSYYEVQFSSGYDVYGFTNFFDANAVGAVDGGDPLYEAFGQPQDRGTFAPSLPYGLALWMLKYSGVATNSAFYGSVSLPVNANTQVGYVWTVTNATTGAGEFRVSSGGGGGSGNVTGPNSSTIGNVALFSAGDGQHIGDGGTLGTAAFQSATAFDASGAAGGVQAFATAYSNSLNLASGNSAAVPTNRFVTPTQLASLSNNINGANIFGQVPAASLGSGSGISTKFLRGDLTWQSIVGGGDMLAANNLSDVANTTTALANLNGVRNTRSLTLSGTANQITSSSGAQDLTADRTWTLSLSSSLILPGTLNVTGPQTNQNSLWVHGNQTNDAGIYITGALSMGDFNAAGSSTIAGDLTLNGGSGVIRASGSSLSNLIHSSTVTFASGGSVALSQNADGSTNYALTATGTGNVVDTNNNTFTKTNIFNGLTVLNGGISITGPVSIANADLTNITLHANIDFLGTYGLVNVAFTAWTNLNVWTRADTIFDSTYGSILHFTAGSNNVSAPGAIQASNVISEHFIGNSSLTNTVSWTHEGTTTNITAAFNGTLQTFTVTNGPTVFFHYSGANGSISYRIYSTNFTTLAFDFQPKWLAGSNNVITNGVLSLTSYGGTNMTTPAQLEAAIRENQ